MRSLEPLGKPSGAMRPSHHLSSTPQLLLCLFFISTSGHALAQGAPVASGVHVQLQVGQQKVLNVGMAMGLECNDGTVVRAELRAVSDSENEVVLTGLKPGKTACRAGTANITRSILINVSVVPKSSP
ncbi:MAG: hypothetical protein ACLQIH_14720 [Myxococcaceae bacterium]